MTVMDRYPQSLKSALQGSPYDNILDSNMFSAYIPRELNIERPEDPRRARALNMGMYRQPGHVPSTHINQIFSYMGFIKRTHNWTYRKYLPALYKELGEFLKVMEDVAYNLDIGLSQEIYEEQKRGFESFSRTYHTRQEHDVEWIDNIWKHQLLYLEQIDMLVETLKTRGRVFDYSAEPLYTHIFAFCREFAAGGTTGSETVIDMDCRFVANCCAKASRDRHPIAIWSGDAHILMILRNIYTVPELFNAFPQVYLHSSYDPRSFAELFP
ncbi:MAG TPA: hypothetical protein VGJ94_00410 [Syntrophorhabdaceae bacterium]|jgi:hypothetical protein